MRQAAETSGGAAGMPASPPLISRRRLLQGGAILGAGAVAAPWVDMASAGASGREVVIVGAGAAGVTCAYQLWTRHGIRADLIDANIDRLGGRTYTIRDVFAGGRTVEAGGAFISSEHTAVRALCRRLELTIETVNGGSQPTGEDAYWADGAVYLDAELRSDLAAAYTTMQQASNAVGHHSALRPTRGGTVLDRLTVPEWIDRAIPGGTGGRLGQILLSDSLSEYGGEPDQQSAINLIWLLGGIGSDGSGDLAGTDEIGHIAEGSDQLVHRMLAQLPGGADAVRRQSLVAVRRHGRRVKATFADERTTRDVVCDHLVLALPFAALRRGVDLSKSGLSPRKRRAIAQLGMGTNGKVQLQLARRSWTSLGYGGIAYSGPDSFQTVWDATAADAGPQPIIIDFPGGTVGATLSDAPFGPVPDAVRERFLDQIEPLFVGTRAAWAAGPMRSHVSCWANEPHTHGAYSYYQPGQLTDFGGTEGQAEAQIHFCGEHTSFEFPGYIEGAVETGLRVAREITTS